LKEHDTVTPYQLRDAILGINTTKPRQVIEIWEENIEDLAMLIGKEVSKATVQKYRTTKNHFRDFLFKKYKVKDLSVKALKPEMIAAFNLYLKTEKGIGYNTAIKFLQSFRRIIKIALRNGWMLKDSFVGVNMSLKEVSRPYLTDEELERIIKLDSRFDRINKVKDFFIFSCFTALAYTDVKKLKGKEIIKTDKGYWIKTQRQKTGGESNIPLLVMEIRHIKFMVDLASCLLPQLQFQLYTNTKIQV